jgi:signal peptidase I
MTWPQMISSTGERKKDLRGTWRQALGSLFGAVLLILVIRWAFFEPYVIPSGSMIPTLLIHDHILVNKFSYGVRAPFTSHWLVHFGLPKRGEVIVFRSVEDDEVYLVKRVVGLPGDAIRVSAEGKLIVNSKQVPRETLTPEEVKTVTRDWPHEERDSVINLYEIAMEDLGEPGSPRKHLTMRTLTHQQMAQGPYVVPDNSLFMMGDNRDNSADSRMWGELPLDRVLGRASLIWLSCEETLPEAKQVCDPSTIRWDRIFKGI